MLSFDLFDFSRIPTVVDCAPVLLHRWDLADVQSRASSRKRHSRFVGEARTAILVIVIEPRTGGILKVFRTQVYSELQCEKL